MKLSAKRLAPALLVSASVLAPAAWAGPPSVRLASAWDLKELTRDFPGAVEAFRQADAAAAAGRREEAARLFAEVTRLAPTSPAAPRRRCELLTELWRRAEALAACRQALKYGDAPEDYRAMVGALMLPSLGRPPTSDDLVQALVIATGLEGRVPHDPAGHAALFDIALGLGDRRLMRARLQQLESLAPDHYETGRARRIVAGLGPGPMVAAGWGLLALLSGATLVRAIGRLKRRRPLLARAVQAAVVAVSLAGAGAANAESPPTGQLSEFKIDENDPEGSLPSRSELRKDPLQYGYLVMDLADRADEAIRGKDYPKAARFYQAIARMAPDRAIGFGKVCEVWEMAGQRTKALEACRQALVTDGVRIDDYERFVRLTLSGAGALTEAEKTELDNVIGHVRKVPDGAVVAAEIECRLGVRLREAARLQRCTAELVKLAPDNTNILGYQWALATLQDDRAAASQILARAKQAGVDLGGLQKMELATHRLQLTRSVSYAVAVVLVLAAAALFLRRRRDLVAAPARRSPS